MGPEVERFEERLAKYCGRRFCIGVASGSDALYLALRAAGIGPGCEVITTPLSWIATLNAIVMTGATARFADVRDDLNLDPDTLAREITPATRAIVPVHFNGRLCDMEPILAIARRHDILVIEDAAQSVGARYNSIPAGGFGQAAAFSLNPMKILAGYGEAGAVVTDDEGLRDKLVALRYLGTVDKEICHYLALNAKLDELQAAMMLVSFDYLEANIEHRLALAQRYSERLKGIVRCPRPLAPGDRSSVFFDYQIVAENRDALRRFLAQQGIETKIKHPILMPDQPAHTSLPRPEIPVARYLIEHILSLPLHEKMKPADVDCVAENVEAFYRDQE